MKFSVIIPMCNHHEELFDALGKIAPYLNAEWQRQSGFGAEVIVADDSSSASLEPLFPGCVYVEAPLPPRIPESELWLALGLRHEGIYSRLHRRA